MPYISSSGQVYTIDGPRQRRVQLEKPILLAVAMLLCVFVLARQGTAALASAVHVKQQRALCKVRGNSVTIDRLRGRLGQACAQKEHRNPSVWPNRNPV